MAFYNFAGQFYSAGQLLRWLLLVEQKETDADGCKAHSHEIYDQLCPASSREHEAEGPDLDRQLDSVLPCRTIRVGLVSDHMGVTADVKHTLQHDLGVFGTARRTDRSSRCAASRQLSITSVIDSLSSGQWLSKSDGNLSSSACSNITRCRAVDELDFFVCLKPAHKCQALAVLNKPMLIWFVLRPDRDWGNEYLHSGQAGNLHVRRVFACGARSPCMRICAWKLCMR